MKKQFSLSTLFAVLFGGLLAGQIVGSQLSEAHAQGSFEPPPGTPGPVMRSLDEIYSQNDQLLGAVGVSTQDRIPHHVTIVRTRTSNSTFSLNSIYNSLTSYTVPAGKRFVVLATSTVSGPNSTQADPQTLLSNGIFGFQPGGSGSTVNNRFFDALPTESIQDGILAFLPGETIRLRPERVTGSDQPANGITFFGYLVDAN